MPASRVEVLPLSSDVMQRQLQTIGIKPLLLPQPSPVQRVVTLGTVSAKVFVLLGL